MPARGEVYTARLSPVEGSEQGGVRPVVIVSRDTLNQALDYVVGVPCTRYRARAIYPTHALLQPPEGGLDRTSVVLCEQVRVLALSRLRRRRGALSADAMAQVDRALAIALALEAQH